MIPALAAYFCPRCGARSDRAGACSRDGMPRAEIRTGSLLGSDVGNYVIVGLVGEGGMGAVYRAVQPAIGAEVAIKVLQATSETRSSEVQRFLGEAQAVNRVRHPGLIKILDTQTLPDGRPYLVMELLDGISLGDAVGSLGPGLAAFVAAEALDALAAVHAEGIVHRDLKPRNVHLTREGRVVVLDFGIAKLADAPANTGSGLLGTPGYMSPEQIRSQPVDHRTDVYAMGVLLYETITGRRPFAAAATFDLLVEHLERPPTSPREYAPALGEPLAAAILRAMEKDPARRFASAAELAAVLRAEPGLGSRAELARFVATRTPAPPPVREPVIADAHAATVAAAPPAAATAAPGRFVATAPARPRAAPAPVANRRPRWPWLLAVPLLAAGGIALAPAEPARTRDPYGFVELRSAVPAAIAIDGMPRGETPLVVHLLPGHHQVHATRDGYADQTVTFDIEPYRDTALRVELTRSAPPPVEPPPPPVVHHAVPPPPPVITPPPPAGEPGTGTARKGNPFP